MRQPFQFPPSTVETQALATARVDQTFLRPAHVVEGDTDIVSVARLFQSQRTGSVIVRCAPGPGGMGIFTTSGLQRAILDGRVLDRLPVRDLATRPLIALPPQAPVFDALALMIRHQIHRVVVAEGEHIVGLLEQLDALSFVSNHSYLVTVQIAQADTLDALAPAATHITRLVALLHRGGMQVAAIARLVQEINSKLFERTWQLVAPPELVAQSCLFVMGSEGRGEQLLRTDQDNGLVLRDDAGITEAELAAACTRFSAALADFGFPECPGGIMVSHPQWRQRERNFAQTVRRWLLKPEPEGLMALAVFLDAQPVAGDATLLASVRAALDGLVAQDDALLGRFAQAIDSFPEAGVGAWWNRLLHLGDAEGEVLDLKKAGIFPIVHGARSLALQQHVGAVSTAARLDALVVDNRLPAALAADLVDSLHFLMGLRLRCALEETDAGQPVSGAVHVGRLTTLDRELLKDALGVVKRFKGVVRHHFHLEA